jgi:hypothetical protein
MKLRGPDIVKISDIALNLIWKLLTSIHLDWSDCASRNRLIRRRISSLGGLAACAEAV